MVLSEHDTGVGVWTRGLIRSLPALAGRNEFFVYHGADAGVLPGPPTRGVRYVRVPVHNRLRGLRIAWEQVLLPLRARQDRLDVLHCPAYVRPVLAGVPTVVTLHDLFALTHPQVCKRLNGLHYRLMIPPSVRGATVIHCTSEWTKSMLAREFGRAVEKAEVIHPGVDGVFQPAQDGSEAGATLARLGLDEPPFLFVGNVEPKKNVPALLDAFAALKRRTGTRRKLLMVGPGHWRTRPPERRIARLGLKGEVVAAGYVPRSDLPAIYRASLALVFPSLWEGFGLPPLEAMACGTPVICSSGSGLSEGAGKAARLVPTDDVPALTDAMEEVERSPDVRRWLREVGLRRARQFRWPEKVREFPRLYELAASGGRPG